MTEEQHRKRHKELHQMLDELVADWIGDTGRLPSSSTILELIEWSAKQMAQPTGLGRGTKIN